MKKFWIFIIGFVAGIIATFLVVFLITVANKPNDGLLGLTIFIEKGDCIETDGEVEVFQVIKSNAALAKTIKHGKYGREYSDEIVVLLIDYDGKTFYDEQKVKVPKNKCARQVGTYQYSTKNNFVKTVPAVVIE